MKILRRIAILSAAIIALGGCAWHNSGPCFGVGCPSWASATPPAAKATAEVAPAPAANQTASAAATEPASTAVSPAPAEKSKVGFFARVKAVFKPKAKTPASNTAAVAEPNGTSTGR